MNGCGECRRSGLCRRVVPINNSIQGHACNEAPEALPAPIPARMNCILELKDAAPSSVSWKYEAVLTFTAMTDFCASGPTCVRGWSCLGNHRLFSIQPVSDPRCPYGNRPSRPLHTTRRSVLYPRDEIAFVHPCCHLLTFSVTRKR